MTYKPKYLGKQGSKYEGLDPIPTENPPLKVTMQSEEVTAMCPLTGQPDFYQIIINYTPDKHLCESKSLKLYFQSLRNKGIFAESLAVETAEEFTKYIHPHHVAVTVEQKARGGVAIVATHQLPVDPGIPPIFGAILGMTRGEPTPQGPQN